MTGVQQAPLGGVNDPAEKLRQRFAEVSPQLLDGLTEVVKRHAALLAQEFYETQLQRPESAVFLSHELVNQRLRPALETWLESLFEARTAEDFRHQVARQVQVGEVHARIGVSVQLVAEGMRVIKRELGKLIVASGFHRIQLAAGVQAMNDILDEALGIITNVYLDRLIDYKRNEQSFRLYAMGQNMETEGQRARVSLFDWSRSVLTLFLANRWAGVPVPPALARSPFGLWLNHKAKLILADAPEIDAIAQLVEDLDSTLQQTAGDWSALPEGTRVEVVQSLNDAINNISMLVDGMIQRALEFEGGRDALTHLLNRRYLPALMQREVNVSMQRGLRFAVALVDIDHFKKINDTHGHDAGDVVLRSVAEVVASRVRASDFVFRYGGEEFLILIAEVTPEQVMRIADTLRQAVAGSSVRLPKGPPLTVTVSIGLAVHDGHPDYQRVITAADKALYRAKKAGRNRCEISGGET